ncbi:MAG: biopolymer transporter ExbD [Pirellulales bacterium]|nr:biopolymer transporter ExbD [Pirellulales bacterium]
MPLKTHIDEQPTMNLTSLIDVVFLLIIFFMVGTRFSEMEHNIDVQVPRVADGGALTDAPARRVINIARDGQITLDGRVVSLGDLSQALAATRQTHQEVGVIIRGDGQGEFQHVAEVMNACKQAGIAELGISVRIAGTAPKRR